MEDKYSDTKTEYDNDLAENLHPSGYVNPIPCNIYNLVVIGGGPAGLAAAAGAAEMGAKVALIEKHLIGGNCLNAGCIPSKTLIRSANIAEEVRGAKNYGVLACDVKVDFKSIMRRISRIKDEISHHEKVQKLTDAGIDVFLGEGIFTGPDRVEVGGHVICFKRALIATGSRASIPNIEGLREAGFLTSDSVFTLTEQPGRLAVIGGGPSGCEYAQAFRRLGTEVILFHNGKHLLNTEDGDAAWAVQNQFALDGMEVIFGSSPLKIEVSDDEKIIHYADKDGSQSISVDTILVCTGRMPNIENLDLEVGGIEFDRLAGIKINDYFQTTNPNIYAAGDVCMAWKYAHAADAAAKAVVKNALLFGHVKLSELIMPWCIYTSPEVAHVGIYKHDAELDDDKVDTYQVFLHELDRAVIDGCENGFVKIHLRKGSDQIVGATAVGGNAGDIISEITLAMVTDTGLDVFADSLHPYPAGSGALRTLGEAYRRAQFGNVAKKVYTTLLAWRRK